MKKKIFIIDDDLIYRMIVAKTIKSIDESILIFECDNGKEGLENLQNLEINRNFEITILLDINMPVLDGWGFLKELRNSKIYADTKFSIFLVSSSTDKSDMLKSEEHDLLKGFFSKPLRRTDIYNILK
ncbi:response regulator [Gillisia sp. Hel_I_29]|uniref:response regulator n=1 Tax=Gillisia sp. Hel_I_29 TaxID=1249975 RepID=UPI00054F493C|nr:response regulator [Gillisia sp. Hel_I_29]